MTDDTQSVSFNILHHLRVKSLVEESIQEPIRSIGAILKSKSFKTEYFIAQSVGLKIATRLRSSRITVVCSQFLKNLHLFCDQKVAFVILPLNLLVEEQLDTRSGNVLIPSNDVMVNILETLSKGCAYLCQAIHYSTFLFADSVMWLKLGHMNQHILPLMSAVSRLSIMCRAIVVYCCDLYKGVHQLLTRLKASHVKKTAPSIDHFLESFSNLPPSTMETDVEPPLPMVCETPAKPSNRTPKPDTLEDIGVCVSRSAFLKVTTKSKGKKKITEGKTPVKKRSPKKKAKEVTPAKKVNPKTRSPKTSLKTKSPKKKNEIHSTPVTLKQPQNVQRSAKRSKKLEESRTSVDKKKKKSRKPMSKFEKIKYLLRKKREIKSS